MCTCRGRIAGVAPARLQCAENPVSWICPVCMQSVHARGVPTCRVSSCGVRWRRRSKQGPECRGPKPGTDGVSGCLLRSVKGTFIGMSESMNVRVHRDIINCSEATTSVSCDPRKNRRTIRPTVNIHTESLRSKCAEESEARGTVHPGIRTPKSGKTSNQQFSTWYKQLIGEHVQ